MNAAELWPAQVVPRREATGQDDRSPAGEAAVAPATLDWMGAPQDHLANTIFTMDRRAKEGEIARRGPEAVDDPVLVDQIRQAAMLQAQQRFPGGGDRRDAPAPRRAA